MSELGYDASLTPTDYQTDAPAALGNTIAQGLIDFGLRDGSNEQEDYANLHYQPTNPPLILHLPGNPDIVNYNRWQPLTFLRFIGQAGNFIGTTPEFLGPEWGEVPAFSLRNAHRTTYEREGYQYQIYHDPDAPPFLDTTAMGGLSEEYKWDFALVSAWSSHLDPSDGILWDISPASIGNTPAFPLFAAWQPLGRVPIPIFPDTRPAAFT